MDNNSGPDLILVKTALDRLKDYAMIEATTVGKATALDTILFTQDTATNAAVVSSVIGGGGYFQTTTDDVPLVPEANIAAAPKKTSLVYEFLQNMPISRTFMADQQLAAVSKAVRQRTAAYMTSRDRKAFVGTYASGFTGANNGTTIDGVPLFSNSHINENGDTVDNLETGALTDSNLNIMINSLRTQINQAGVLIGYEPKALLTPVALHSTGMQVAKSVLRAGTGNNDLNYYSEMFPGMKVVYNPHLDSVSTTAYFVVSNDNGVMRAEREGFFTELVDWRYQSNDQYLYKMRAREVTDAISYDGTVGSTGATA